MGESASERESGVPFARATAVRFTNLDKVFFPRTERHPAYAKLDLARYYDAVADTLLPHLAGRPMVFRRYPNGIAGHAFFQKDFDQATPPFVRKLAVWSEQQGRAYQYVVVDNRDTLLWMVQLGAIEMHPWLSQQGPDPEACRAEGTIASRACGLEYPDVLAFDVDPYVRQGRLGARPREAGGEPGISREDFASAIEVALLVRDTLRSLGLRSWPKTSGKRGIHVYVPIVPEHAYAEVRGFARTIGRHLASGHPRLVTTEYGKEARAGRVFLDTNQNVRGKTLASPWSARPTPEASVSMPLRWDEVEDADPAAYTIESAPRLLAERGDPWRDFAPQDLDRLLAGEAEGKTAGDR